MSGLTKNFDANQLIAQDNNQSINKQGAINRNSYSLKDKNSKALLMQYKE